MILQLFAHVTSRRDLDLWPLDLELLQHFDWHAFKLCSKFERNRIINGWVFTKLRDVIGRPGDHHSIALLFQGSDILLHFQTRAAQSWVMLKKTPNFALFDTLWKLWEGWASKISIPIVYALPTTEPSEYIWWPSNARPLSAVYWQKKNRKKSWWHEYLVKLKVFRPIGRAT